jgi:hypothetical protein
MRRVAERSLLLVAVLSALGSPAAAADGVAECTADQLTSWKRMRSHTLGVRAADDHPLLDPSLVPSPDRTPLEACPSVVDFSLEQDGRANDGVHSWVFASACKVAVCGQLRSFEPYWHLSWLTGEFDLNNNIAIARPGPSDPLPGEFHPEMLDRHLCFPEESRGEASIAREEPRLCFPQTDELHVEMTPPPSLRPLLRHLWLQEERWGWARWRASLEDETLCVYGPFVGDTAHGAKAEIHPAQLLWWSERPDAPDREAFGPGGPLALFLVQDASGRYSDEHHFVLGRRPPAGSQWKPWAGGPVTGTFAVPFRLGEGEGPVRFSLAPYERDGVRVTAPRLRPCPEDAPQLEVTVSDGAGTPARSEVVARLCNQTQATGADEISLEGSVLCRHAENALGAGEPSGYLGVLTIRARTGSDREWGEGHLGLMLTDSRSPRRSEPSAGPVAAEHGRESGPAITPMVTWRATPGAPWVRAELGDDPQRLARATRAIGAMFEAAGWEGDALPFVSLWHLARIDLEVDAAVRGVPEEKRKSRRVRADFPEKSIQARPLVAGDEGGSVPLRVGGPARATLDLAELARRHGSFTPWQLDVPIRVSASYEAAAGGTVTPDPAPIGSWRLWTHGLGARPESLWHDAARALCTRLAPKAPSGARAIPADDLRILVGNATRDGIVSLTELHFMALEIRRVCGAAERGPARPVRAMAR